MNRGLWIARKNILCNLIKKVSYHWGGDDIDWLKEYCKEILQRYQDDKIEEAITCFIHLSDQLKWVPRRTQGECNETI